MVWFDSSVTEAAADGARGMKRWRMAERSCGCQGDGRCRMLHADNIKRERKKSGLRCRESLVQHHLTFTKKSKHCREDSSHDVSPRRRTCSRGTEVVTRSSSSSLSLCFIIAAFCLKFGHCTIRMSEKKLLLARSPGSTPLTTAPLALPRLHRSGCQRRQVSLSEHGRVEVRFN